MFIAYAQKPPVNAHAGESSGNVGLIIILVFIYIHFIKYHDNDGRWSASSWIP